MLLLPSFWRLWTSGKYHQDQRFSKGKILFQLLRWWHLSEHQRQSVHQKNINVYWNLLFPINQRFIASTLLKGFSLSTEAPIQKSLYKLPVNSFSVLKGDFCPLLHQFKMKVVLSLMSFGYTWVSIIFFPIISITFTSYIKLGLNRAEIQ